MQHVNTVRQQYEICNSCSVVFIYLINAESSLKECMQPRAPSQRGSCDLPAVKPLSLAYCWAKYMAVFWHLSWEGGLSPRTSSPHHFNISAQSEKDKLTLVTTLRLLFQIRSILCRQLLKYEIDKIFQKVKGLWQKAPCEGDKDSGPTLCFHLFWHLIWHVPHACDRTGNRLDGLWMCICPRRSQQDFLYGPKQSGSGGTSPAAASWRRSFLFPVLNLHPSSLSLSLSLHLQRLSVRFMSVVTLSWAPLINACLHF